MVELVKKDVGNGQSFKLAACYLTKKQIKFWPNLVRILITQPRGNTSSSVIINILTLRVS